MPANHNNPPSRGSREITVTPELVKQVTDKVFVLLLKDLQIERERLQGIKRPPERKGTRK